jgi:hypothetical protein
VNRGERRERLKRVVHAMTAVGLISQGLGNVGDPSVPGLLVALPLMGGALAVGSAVQHRWRVRSRFVEPAASILEGLTCAVVGATAAARGTRYLHYAWFLAAAFLVASAFIKSRRTEIA